VCDMKTLHRGKLATNPKIISVRPLTRDDLGVLVEKRPVQGVVKTFRDSHHRVARLVAAGLRPDEVALRSGYTNTRILTLKGDPAFQELVAQYRERVTEKFEEEVSSFFEVATANMLKAEVMLSDKIDEAIDANEFLPTKDLIAISEGRADRFGYPKQKSVTQTNINVDFASALEAAARRSGRSNVIDASPNAPAGNAPRPRVLSPSTPSANQMPQANIAGIRRRA
jgi:hypothetical protein